MSCKFCSKPTPRKSRNYCNWDCHIGHAQSLGGKQHTPNNLPIRCITKDGLMLEVEGGDHPDYLFPIEIEYAGDPDLLNAHELHALIYTDGSVAISMYEGCYAMWYLPSGELVGGSLWDNDKYRVTPDSVTKMTQYMERKRAISNLPKGD